MFPSERTKCSKQLLKILKMPFSIQFPENIEMLHESQNKTNDDATLH